MKYRTLHAGHGLSGPRLIEEMSIPEPNSGCWLWLGNKGSSGYGRIKHNRRSVPAHRLSWAIYKGPIPEGLLVCHRCDTPLCVNPDHLWLGTSADNSHDMAVKGRAGALRMTGERGSNAKLTEAQVLQVLASREKGRALAERFGVSKSTISMIRSGRNWAYLRRSAP